MIQMAKGVLAYLAYTNNLTFHFVFRILDYLFIWPTTTKPRASDV